MSLSRAPPPTFTRRADGSTCTLFIRRRSITSPSSTVERPAKLWPPPRTAISSPASRANVMAAATSASDSQQTITAG